MSIKLQIDQANIQGLKDRLTSDPSLANLPIPFSIENTKTAHPIHRVCDGVFEKKYSEQDALAMVKILLEFGASINGTNVKVQEDSPLIAASSLQCDEVSLLLIAQGADITHQGTHGGTALHWAAWCGRIKILNTLIPLTSNINQRCIDFKSTPIYWAVHGYIHGGIKNRFEQIACIKALLESGADLSIPNAEGQTIHQLVGQRFPEITQALNEKGSSN